MKIVFFGTPDYVVPVVDKLNKSFRKRSQGNPIVAVVTQKPKPAGRKKQLEYSAVDKWACKNRVHVHYNLVNLPSADLGILASFGQIIPKKVIDSLPHGILNIHFSLLPELRGAAPIPATLVLGKKEAGVTIFKLDELLDHGPIISQFTEEILPEDTTGTLMIRLFERSAEVLTTLIPSCLKGKIVPRKQDHKKATFTRLIKKADAFIPPKYLKATLQGSTFKGKWKVPFMKTKSSQASLMKNYYLTPSTYSLERFIRAMQPWPVAWTRLRTDASARQAKRLKILKAHVEKLKAQSSPARKSLALQAPAGGKRKTQLKSSNVSSISYLVLDEVQLEGKNPVSWEQFKRGYPESRFN